jgi:hypothetical protein
MIEIFPREIDDKNFIEMVEQILYVGLNLAEPKEVFLIQIDHWFDFKWRQFSHKVLGELGVWNKELRIPPFSLDRVVEELFFQKTAGGYESKPCAPLHLHQSSENNNYRKINLLSDSAIFLWYSGDTIKNSQASVMVYYVSQNFQKSWYVSFLKKENWQIYKADNISKHEVKAMLENDCLALIR